MDRVLSSVEVPKEKIPALHLEKYNRSAALLSHCNDHCHNSAFWGGGTVCLKCGVKTRRIFIRTHLVVSFQLMINTNDIKTRGSWVACGPGVLFIRSSLLLLSVGLPVANAPDVLQPCGLLYYP